MEVEFGKERTKTLKKNEIVIKPLESYVFLSIYKKSLQFNFILNYVIMNYNDVCVHL